MGSGGSWTSLGEQDPMLLGPCTVSIPATTATPFMGPLQQFFRGKDRSRLIPTREAILSTWLLSASSQQDASS